MKTELASNIFVATGKIDKATQATQAAGSNDIEKADTFTADYIDTPNATDILTEANATYNAGTANAINDMASNNEQVQGKTHNIKDTELWKDANLNLSKDTSQGNLNEQNFRNTLQYSRLADMLNNKMYLVPSSIGARTATRGSTGTGLDQIGIGMQKGPQIETQETRQMRANEQADMLGRQQDIKRKGSIQDRALVIQQQLDQNLVNAANTIGMNKLALSNLIAQLQVQKEYGATYDTLLQQIYNTFVQNLSLHNKERIANFINKNKSDFIYATLFGQQAGVTVPGAFTQAINSLITKARADKDFDDMSDEELSNFIRYMVATLSGIAGSTLNAAAPEFASEVLGIGGKSSATN